MTAAVAVHTPAPVPIIPAAHSITELLHLAVERGTPVEALEKLVALHERMEAREAAKAFAAAMVAFKVDCPMIKKTSTAQIVTKKGGRYSYTYAELDEIVSTVQPLLNVHGFSYTWDTRVETNGMLTCTITLRHIAGHTEQSSFTLPTTTDSAMSDQQKMGAASTFAKRQTLIAVLGLTTTDNDYDAAAIDPTPITTEQLFQLEDMIEDSGADKARFLTFIGVEKLSELRAVHFDQAVSALKQKKGATT